jgi:hypothetical protein
MRQWAATDARFGNSVTGLFEEIDRRGWIFDPQQPSSQFDIALYKPTNEDLSQAFSKTALDDVIKSMRLSKPVTESQIPEITKGFTTTTSPQRRILAVTSTGLLCNVPPETRVLDKIAVVQKSDLPFVLREIDALPYVLGGSGVPILIRGDELLSFTKGTDGQYYFIGQCYVHGIMDGERWENSVEQGAVREIRIV